jgi:hypothetical protein
MKLLGLLMVGRLHWGPELGGSELGGPISPELDPSETCRTFIHPIHVYVCYFGFSGFRVFRLSGVAMLRCRAYFPVVYRLPR